MLILEGIIIGVNSLVTELILVVVTSGAAHTGVDVWANADDVTNGMACDISANFGYTANDLVSWDDGVTCTLPAVGDGVDVAVASTMSFNWGITCHNSGFPLRYAWDTVAVGCR